MGAHLSLGVLSHQPRHNEIYLTYNFFHFCEENGWSCWDEEVFLCRLASVCSSQCVSVVPRGLLGQHTACNSTGMCHVASHACRTCFHPGIYGKWELGPAHSHSHFFTLNVFNPLKLPTH